MKLTPSKLKQIIREERAKINEAGTWMQGLNQSKLPVQVISIKGGENFKNLKAAQKKYPHLNPDKGGSGPTPDGSSGFHGAMRGEIKGKIAMRFETTKAYKFYST